MPAETKREQPSICRETRRLDPLAVPLVLRWSPLVCRSQRFATTKSHPTFDGAASRKPFASVRKFGVSSFAPRKLRSKVVFHSAKAAQQSRLSLRESGAANLECGTGNCAGHHVLVVVVAVPPIPNP